MTPNATTPVAETAMSPQGLYEAISLGLAMGQGAKRLFAVPWESLLATDVQQVRHDLGITPVLTGIRSWTANPSVADMLAR
ncbi:MAG: Coenzyme (ubiquinone) biosynthesis protein Coq4 [Cyanobacteriota bacterium]|jgi:ubiquinone biosynthesis protein Coq4